MELPGMATTIFALLFAFLPEALLLKNSPLHCHQCIAFSCSNELTICYSARDFVRKQLPVFYNMNDDYPACPDPSAIDDWERLKKTSPSSNPCQQIADGEATCVLGRFRVVTHITESNVNLTAHGTVLGCANRELLTGVGNDLIGRPRSKDSFHTLRECHSDTISSPVKNSLKHFLEMEHCSKPSDICHDKSFCINPELSVVMSFQDTTYDSNIPMKIFIWIGIAFAVLIAVVTCLGIKYN